MNRNEKKKRLSKRECASKAEERVKREEERGTPQLTLPLGDGVDDLAEALDACHDDRAEEDEPVDGAAQDAHR